MKQVAAAHELPFWGPLFMVGLPGPRLDAAARELVRDLKVGGIILFARNLEHPQQVRQLTRDLQEEARAAGGPPLLIALDQEGGPVQRLKDSFTRIPAARELGERASPEEVELLARKVAGELAAVGVNVNLAPVADVARSPDCPQWERSYSSDPARVALFATAAIKGYLAGGVIPVAKHFPGLGDTRTDSHEELPRTLSEDPEREADLLPFRQAIRAGVPVIMTAHVHVPAWDKLPATLSPVALQGWLRQKLGFSGVIVTDDLEMGAIAGQRAVAEAAPAALAAGADLLLVCRDWQGAWEAARAMALEGSLTSRARESATRLFSLRTLVKGPLET